MAHRYKLDPFTQGYVTAALWSSTDDKGNPLDDQYGIDDISYSAFEQMVNDCERFQRVHGPVLTMAFESPEYRRIPDSTPMETAGHDFWLTRNGHGAGFWDGDYPKEIGETLTKASKGFGECDLYVGDDRKLYVS